MARSTDALAELAERLKTGLSEKFGIPDDADPFQADVILAVRIVAELAKVEDWTNDYGADEPRPYSSVSAIKECRAIAEEGAEDGR